MFTALFRPKSPRRRRMTRTIMSPSLTLRRLRTRSPRPPRQLSSNSNKLRSPTSKASQPISPQSLSASHGCHRWADSCRRLIWRRKKNTSLALARTTHHLLNISPESATSSPSSSPNSRYLVSQNSETYESNVGSHNLPSFIIRIRISNRIRRKAQVFRWSR
jgi:hypothetical protein